MTDETDPRESRNQDDPHSSTGALAESGGRLYSLDGVIERIELAFVAETPPDRLRELVDEAEQRTVLHDLTDYVLVTTGLRLSQADVRRVIDALYGLIFRLGPVDAYLADDSVCDLTIDGSGSVNIRHFGEAWQMAPEHFLDADQVTRLVERIAIRAGVPFGDGMAALTEIRAAFLGRAARLSVSAPPISPLIEVAIRLHPATPPTFDSLIAEGRLSSESAALIRQVIADRRGILIAGEPGAGKTIFAQMLLPLITADPDQRLMLIERAGEMRAPADAMVTHYGAPDLVAPIQAALKALTIATAPTWVIADEVRADDVVDWWALLNAPHSIPIWVFASSRNPSRLYPALNITLRQQQNDLPPTLVDQAIQDRLPLVVLLGQRGSRTDKPQVLGVGGWLPRDNGDLRLSLKV